MKLKAIRRWSVGLACTCLLAVPLTAKEVVHACAGVVRRIDHAGKIIVVKLADGTERTFAFGAKTSWRGSRQAERDASKGVVASEKGVTEGAQVVVHYTGAGKAGREAAVAVTRIDDAMVHTIEGTVQRTDAAARTITVKTADGAKHVLSFGGETVVDTGEGIEHCTANTVEGLNKLGKVTVHYTESGGRKAVHLIRKAL